MAKAWRILAAVALTLIGVAVLAGFGSRTNANDFVEYWSAGQLFVHGANPYSAPMILALEKSRGFTPDAPLIMLNPPWALPMVAPLGFLPALAALVLWIIAAVGCILTSLLLLDVPPQNRTLAFLFAPVLGCFAMEQSSPFLLLGFSLFLRFHRSRPFLAGASLLLMAIKPHLFMVFWVILLAECIYRRRFMILAGFAASLACVSALVTLIRPHVWQDYFALLHQSTLDQNSYPTLPSLLRAVINVNLPWIATIPLCAAIVWGIVYYWRRRSGWDWRREGMLVMMVAVLTSPYCWISDEVVLLPSVTSALASSPRRFSIEILTAINFAGVVGICITIRSLAWLPLALFLWYLYAARKVITAPVDGDGSATPLSGGAVSLG
jgi:Glycosyltransferase family 87